MSDIAKLKTKQHTYPRLDKSKYQKRTGLEGPFMTNQDKLYTTIIKKVST